MNKPAERLCCLYLVRFAFRTAWVFCMCLFFPVFAFGEDLSVPSHAEERERISLNEGWLFYKYESALYADSLIYDVRPEVSDRKDDKPADARPTEAVKAEVAHQVLKPWILPTGNAFLKDPEKKYARPQGNPGRDFPFVKPDFNDRSWEKVNLPHDWAIKGPFYEGWEAEVGGGMGRLPSPGVAWYRKKLFIPASDSVKSIFLDVDGAMSYAMVWLNGHLVGGWPYGYASWCVDLTPYVIPGEENQLAIRLDNPPNSSRWYPGGGIYRNVWLVKTHAVHVGQWGTIVKARDVSNSSAIVDLEVDIDNDLSFVAVRITNKEGLLVPQANNLVRFAIEGPGEIIVTDNGDATDMTPFPATERKAFNGLCLVIVRSQENKPGTIEITVKSEGLESAEIYIYSKEEK